MPSTSLRVGTARVDITPPAGTQVAGGIGARRIAEFALDPLYVRANVFELGGRKLAIVVFDATIITLPITQAVRAAAAEMGFAPDAVMVQATQTHTAPGLGQFMLDDAFMPFPAEFDFIRGNDPTFDQIAVRGAVNALRQANTSLHPVKLGIGSGYEGRLAFNRRGITKDGCAVMPWYGSCGPLGPTHVKYAEGPMDPEVGVLAARSNDMKLRSVLIHYTCHPVWLFPRPVISADWCGATCDEVERLGGMASFGGMATVLNGCCGDVNPWPFYQPDFTFDHLSMGRELCKMSRRVIESMSFHDPDVLDWKVQRIHLPVRPVEAQKLAAAEKILREQPIPVLAANGRDVSGEWMRAASTYSVHLLHQRSPRFEYEIQVLRLGDAVIVGMPGEPFAIGGIRVKMASPAKLTITAHMTTQYVGYLPTREAIPHGGHEVDTSYWAKFQPEALDLVVDAAGRLIQSMFQ